MEKLQLPYLDREFFDRLSDERHRHINPPDEYIEKFNQMQTFSVSPFSYAGSTPCFVPFFDGIIHSQIDFGDGTIAVLRRAYNSVDSTVYHGDEATTVSYRVRRGGSILMQSDINLEDPFNSYLGGINLFGHTINRFLLNQINDDSALQYMVMTHSVSDSLKAALDSNRINMARYLKPDLRRLEGVQALSYAVDIEHVPIEEIPANNIISIFVNFRTIGSHISYKKGEQEKFEIVT